MRIVEKTKQDKMVESFRKISPKYFEEIVHTFTVLVLGNDLETS